MDQQVRRIDAQYGLNLTEAEIERIAREAEAQENILQTLYTVELDQTRPIMGIAKRPLARRPKRGRK